jgi:hypothetical protein
MKLRTGAGTDANRLNVPEDGFPWNVDELESLEMTVGAGDSSSKSSSKSGGS